MCRQYLAILLLVTGWLSGCTKKPDVQFPKNIPVAKPDLYRSILDMKNWQNPYVTVYPDGLHLEGHSGTLQASELVQKLAGLPKESWPYGRVIAVGQLGIRSGNDDQLIEALWQKTTEKLKALGLTIEQVPSA